MDRKEIKPEKITRKGRREKTGNKNKERKYEGTKGN